MIFSVKNLLLWSCNHVMLGTVVDESKMM